MRAGLKRAAEALLVFARLPNVSRASLRGRTLVLAYHNVVPDDLPFFGDRSLHLPRSAFAHQLDELVRHCTVVGLDALFAAPDARPRAVITFDDAYVGAVTHGIQELAERGLPATIFVPPGLLGGQGFWWDALAGATDLPEQVREQALDRLQGKDAAIRRWAAEAGKPASTLPLEAHTASVEQLRDAAGRAGITIGSHTWSHPNLARLAPEELAAELEQPRRWLAERFGSRFVPWLSYPYGRYSPEVETAAAGAGYAGAFRIDGGWTPCGARPGFALPRLNVPAGLSGPGFALRAAGMFCR
jgi:peptidoglycan/xylan/chitin deacetylase (PgdA/CDA1 family)